MYLKSEEQEKKTKVHMLCSYMCEHWQEGCQKPKPPEETILSPQSGSLKVRPSIPNTLSVLSPLHAPQKNNKNTHKQKTNTHTHTCTHAHAHAPARTHTQTNKQPTTQTLTQTQTQTLTDTDTNTDTDTERHMQKHKQKHTLAQFSL